ncbi:MAG: hypothetical protein ACLT3W_05910 [Bifidobacterium pseudocatenulatum]
MQKINAEISCASTQSTIVAAIAVAAIALAAVAIIAAANKRE